MYKNPLNNGDISDNNSLKKQRDYGSRVKKYEKKLPTEPTELQKYYQYMTYQQPILDELNYVAERMRTEDINKKKDDFNFVEDLKIEREKKMKQQGQKENDIRNDLFDYTSTVKQDDMTPTINTDVELNLEIAPAPVNDLFDDGIFDLFSNADTELIKVEKFELSKEIKKRKEKTPEQLEEIEAKKQIKKAENEARKEANRQKRKAETQAKKEAKKEAKKIERQNKFLNYK